jgi:hypothetical protein
MSRVFEWIFSGLLDVSNFFENLREKRHDAPITAEYKAKKRACLWSLVLISAVLLVTWAAGTFLNGLDGFQGAQGPVADARAWALPVLIAALAFAVLFALYVWSSLFRFMQKHHGM